MLISIADYFKIRTRYGHYFSVTDIIMFIGVMMRLDKANWLEILISECCSICHSHTQIITKNIVQLIYLIQNTRFPSHCLALKQIK